MSTTKEDSTASEQVILGEKETAVGSQHAPVVDNSERPISCGDARRLVSSIVIDRLFSVMNFKNSTTK